MTVREGSDAGAGTGAGSATLPREALRELAALLGMSAVPGLGEQWAGATSAVVRWGGDLTLKVPRDDPSAVEACLRHADVCAAVSKLGVPCAEVLLTADLRPLVAVPVVVSRFLPGARLEPGDPAPDVWHEVGARLALLHAAAPDTVPAGLRRFEQTPATDPAIMAENLIAMGSVTRGEGGRLIALRNRLHPSVPPDGGQVFCHGDVHAGNIIAQDGRLVGFVDFAGAGWLDAAWDFAAIPHGAIGHAVGGYFAAGGASEALLQRIAWCRLQLALHRGLEEGGLRIDVDDVIAATEVLLEP